MSRDDALFRAACPRVEALARERHGQPTRLSADEIVARVLVDLAAAIDISPHEPLLRSRLVELASRLLEAQAQEALFKPTVEKR